LVISDDLSAAMTAHRKTTIANNCMINHQITHMIVQEAEVIPDNNVVEVVAEEDVPPLEVVLAKAPLIFNLNSHIVISSHFGLIFTHQLSQLAVEVDCIHLDTVFINKNQNDKAAITYTGTIASAINSFKLNLLKNQSQPHSFLSKKYISQNMGEIIVYIHIYIHLTINTNQRVIINIANINTNNTSKATLNIKSQIVFILLFVSAVEIFHNLSKWTIQYV